LKFERILEEKAGNNNSAGIMKRRGKK